MGTTNNKSPGIWRCRFLACWWEQNEVPFFLILGDRVFSKIVLESGEECTGLHNWLVLPGLHSFTDVLWELFPVEEVWRVVGLIRQWGAFKVWILHFTSSFQRTWWKAFDTTRWRGRGFFCFCDIHLLSKARKTLENQFQFGVGCCFQGIRGFRFGSIECHRTDRQFSGRPVQF